MTGQPHGEELRVCSTRATNPAAPSGFYKSALSRAEEEMQARREAKADTVVDQILAVRAEHTDTPHGVFPDHLHAYIERALLRAMAQVLDVVPPPAPDTEAYVLLSARRRNMAYLEPLTGADAHVLGRAPLTSAEIPDEPSARLAMLETYFRTDHFPPHSPGLAAWADQVLIPLAEEAARDPHGVGWDQMIPVPEGAERHGEQFRHIHVVDDVRCLRLGDAINLFHLEHAYDTPEDGE